MKQHKTVVPGLILILVGLWALLNSLGFAWMRMDRLWPLVLIVVGLLSIYGGLTRDPGIVALIVGGVGFLFTTGQIDADIGLSIASWWPLILIVIGLGLIAQFLIQRQ